MNEKSKTVSLAVFRFLFGLMMCFGIIRFWWNGWIEKLYLDPSFHFHYSWFDFIDTPGNLLYGVFILCGLSSLAVALGFRYRISSILFFLSFTYIELLDKTTYLNHYYLISVVSFIMIWLSAHRKFSLDAYLGKVSTLDSIPSWNIDILKLMLAVVYLHAGFAKLNHDWLFEAMPLSIWLSSKSDLALIGPLMNETWFHYLMSWGGVVYDLIIVFLLVWKPTRIYGFGLVVVFHGLTAILFPIGMFPYIMIIGTLIFFGTEIHQKIANTIGLSMLEGSHSNEGLDSLPKTWLDKLALPVLSLVMLFQIVLPLRHFTNNGDLFWTENGYRFSWKVMLMEKTGYANFKIVNGTTKERFYVRNDDFLSTFQEKQMSTQPDFILEYGQHLGRHFESQGHENVEVYVESYAALNGRRHQVFISPDINLMKINYAELCQSHILPLRG